MALAASLLWWLYCWGRETSWPQASGLRLGLLGWCVLARSVMWELPNFSGLQLSHVLGGNSETPKDWYSLCVCVIVWWGLVRPTALCNCLVGIGSAYSSAIVW